MSADSNRTMPSLPGYRLLRAIGTGGSGTVYLAEQLSLGREVAIKVFDKLPEAAGPSATRIDRETSVMGRESHPNVVRVIDHGVVEDLPFLVMEYLPGGSLRDAMLPRVPMLIERARPIVESIGSALAAIHAKGFVHRDVKPENVLLDDAGGVRLTDFGLVRAVDDDVRVTTDETAIGTVDYMAPEQRHRLPVDARADQYALAVLAYELLTGVVPQGVPRRPSALNRALPHEIDGVLLRGLRNDPDERYASVTEFVRVLGGAVSRPEPRRGDDRRWTWAAVLAASVVATAPITMRWAMPNAVATAGPATPAVESAIVVPQTTRVRQAAALPFRVRDGVTEVLLVRTRRDSHWTTAKANASKPEDGPSIAEEEAFEEAGVMGVARTAPLGEYRYERGNTDYVVVVHAVEVERELDEWPEQFRRRRWCTPGEAAELVPSDGLRRVLLSCGERLRRE